MISYRLLILLAASTCFSLFTSGQEAINRTDENGLKQGKWIKKFENGSTLYEGLFKDNRPVGEFTRYYIGGNPVSILNYHPENDSVDAVFYHPNEYLAARGTYIKQSKEGKWTFYSAKEKDRVICVETYINNKKEGLSTKYHLNGNIAEELFYINDMKDGSWLQYFTDGTICIKSTYSNDKVKGKFETFFPDGKKEICGNYLDDVRVGEWLFYNQDGSLKRTINYIDGIPENNSELIEEETKYLDMLEKNGGKIQDPEKTGVIW